MEDGERKNKELHKVGPQMEKGSMMLQYQPLPGLPNFLA